MCPRASPPSLLANTTNGNGLADIAPTGLRRLFPSPAWVRNDSKSMLQLMVGGMFSYHFSLKLRHATPELNQGLLQGANLSHTFGRDSEIPLRSASAFGCGFSHSGSHQATLFETAQSHIHSRYAHTMPVSVEFLHNRHTIGLVAQPKDRRHDQQFGISE